MREEKKNFPMSTDVQLACLDFLFLMIIIKQVILFIFLAIDDGEDLDINYLTGIYERIRSRRISSR